MQTTTILLKGNKLDGTAQTYNHRIRNGNGRAADQAILEGKQSLRLQEQYDLLRCRQLSIGHQLQRSAWGIVIHGITNAHG